MLTTTQISAEKTRFKEAICTAIAATSSAYVEVAGYLVGLGCCAEAENAVLVWLRKHPKIWNGSFTVSVRCLISKKTVKLDWVI